MNRIVRTPARNISCKDVLDIDILSETDEVKNPFWNQVLVNENNNIVQRKWQDETKNILQQPLWNNVEFNYRT